MNTDATQANTESVETSGSAPRSVPIGFATFVCVMLTLSVSAYVAGLEADARAFIASFGARTLAVLTVIAGIAWIYICIRMSRNRWHWPLFLAPPFAIAVFLYAYSFVEAGSRRVALDQTMRVAFGPDYVQISGRVGPDLVRLLSNGMAKDLPVSRVHLANSGGDVNAAMDAVTLLKKRGVRIAVVEGDCASACAIMATMFAERLIDQASKGRLGFHDLEAVAGNENAKETMRETVIEGMLANGIEPLVAAGIFDTKDFRIPDLVELLRDKMITGCWDPASKVKAGCRLQSPD